MKETMSFLMSLMPFMAGGHSHFRRKDRKTNETTLHREKENAIILKTEQKEGEDTDQCSLTVEKSTAGKLAR